MHRHTPSYVNMSVELQWFTVFFGLDGPGISTVKLRRDSNSNAAPIQMGGKFREIVEHQFRRMRAQPFEPQAVADATRPRAGVSCSSYVHVRIPDDHGLARRDRA